MTDHDFYKFQNEWSSIYFRDISDNDFDRVKWVKRITGKKVGRLLELGAGGGQFSVAASLLNYQVTAVEIEQKFIEHIHSISKNTHSEFLKIVNQDFYSVEFDTTFDIICYWDGFGIGSDNDQRRLLKKISTWLSPGGSVFLEIFTPWFWASEAAGVQFDVGEATRQYGFDAESCSLIDTWWKKDDPSLKRTQTLRCYAPADLALLLEGSGLKILENYPGGKVDYTNGSYIPEVPLHQAMSYISRLIHS